MAKPSSNVVFGLLFFIVLLCAFSAQYFVIRDSLTISKNFVEIVVDEKSEVTVAFELKNNSSNEVVVTSMDKNCDCAIAQELPVQIQPNSSVAIEIQINCSEVSKSVKREFYFYTDPPYTGLLATALLVVENER